MTPEYQLQEELRIGFIFPEASTFSRSDIVTVNNLATVLSSFQQIVYIMAAYDLNRAGLTQEQRVQYALGIKAYRQGSLWVDLIPIAVLEAMRQMSLFPEITKALLESAFWDIFRHSIDAMAKQFGGGKLDERIDRPMLNHNAEIAKVAIETGQTIEARYRDQHGNESFIRTSREGNDNILTRQQMMTIGDLQRYEDCLVLNLLTTTPTIVVESPRFPGRQLRCEYDQRCANEIAQNIRLYDRIIIVGRPVYLPTDLSDALPNSVKIDYILDERGTHLVKPL